MSPRFLGDIFMQIIKSFCCLLAKGIAKVATQAVPANEAFRHRTSGTVPHMK